MSGAIAERALPERSVPFHNLQLRPTAAARPCRGGSTSLNHNEGRRKRGISGIPGKLDAVMQMRYDPASCAQR